MIKDHKKFREDFTRILNSYTDEEVLEWLEMDRKRMALLEDEEKINNSQITAKPHRVSAKLKGATRRSAVKSNVVLAEA